MRHFAALLCACALFAACDDDSAVDLAVSTDLAMGPDLAAPDLASMVDMAVLCRPEMEFPPPDAAGFCDGTPLAGTCAQAFFARVAACYNPAGCCIGDGMNTVYRSWESGAHYSYSLATSRWMLTQNGMGCASSVDSTLPNALQWSGPDGSELPFFDPNTGELHCPDGSQLNVGPFGQCPELQRLLKPFQFYSCQSPYNATCCTPYPL
jgi:hypothetical protein